MTCVLLTIPDDPHQLASWLEGILTGGELAQAVRELAVVQGRELEPARRGELAAILGAEQGKVLQAGLNELPAERIRQLTARPEVLLELQELLLVEGSVYWQQQWQKTFPAKTTVREKVIPAVRTQARPVAIGWIVAVAAAVLLMVGVINWPRSPEVAAWGWNAPQLLTANNSASEHLTAIAAAGEEWFKQKPATAGELKQRISELKQGCERLIAAQHSQLQPADEKWLKEKCQAWLDKINAQLAALQDDSTAPQVQQEMDAIVTKLVETLRKKALELEA